jgi:hypothetical protein
VINRDYQPEKHKPEVREFPDGLLPQPKRPPPNQDMGPCMVETASGSRTEATSCSVVDDLIIYVTTDGRRHRSSLDLAWPAGVPAKVR